MVPCAYNLALRRLRQEDHCEFQTAGATEWDPASKEKEESECAVKLNGKCRNIAGVTVKENSNYSGFKAVVDI